MVGYQNSDSTFRIAAAVTAGAAALTDLVGSYRAAVLSKLTCLPSAQAIITIANSMIESQLSISASSTGVVTQSTDGNLDPATQSQLPVTAQLSNGVIGISSDLTLTTRFQGTIQCMMVIDRVLTQLERDQLSGYLAWRYNQVADLPVSHPYKYFAPTNEATLTSDPMTSFSVVWQDTFQSLSLRTGGYYSGTTTGYNDPGAKGTWAFDPQSYMTSPTGYAGFGKDFFINANYNWQAIDPTFPPLGMADITADGLYLFGSENYPAIRATLPAPFGIVPFLAPHLGTTQSMKVGFPFARKWLFTLPSTGSYDFPALWSLGDHYNGNPAHPNHQEWDDFERFGVEFVDASSSQGELLLSITGGTHGIKFNTGIAIAGGAQTELTCVVFADRALFYTNGVLTLIAPHSPPGFDVYDLAHALVNFSVGMSFEAPPGTCNVSITGTTATITVPSGGHIDYAVGQTIAGSGIAPGTIIIAGSGRGFGGTATVNISQTTAGAVNATLSPVLTQVPNMTVRSVQYLAPPTNISGIFPATPPVPVITWGGSYTGGFVPVGTASGTVVATLSGAATYTLLDYNGAVPSHLAVSGSNVVVSGTLSVGIFNFYIRGVDGSGTPAIAPKLTLTVPTPGWGRCPTDCAASIRSLSGLIRPTSRRGRHGSAARLTLYWLMRQGRTGRHCSPILTHRLHRSRHRTRSYIGRSAYRRAQRSASINAGTYDANFLSIANKIIAARPSDAFYAVRPLWEAQNSGMVWYAVGNEANYQLAFQRIVGIFRGASAKFKFDWSMNETTTISTVKYDPTQLYPGDAYVDLIGQDFYWESGVSGIDPDAAWRLKQNDTYGLNFITAFALAHNKPLAFAEWGLNYDAPQYVSLALEFFALNNVALEAYFNADNGGQFNNRLDLNQYPNVSTRFKIEFSGATLIVNLLSNGNVFTSAPWSGVGNGIGSITAGQPDPFGGTSASKLLETAATSQHYIQAGALTVSSTPRTYRLISFAKPENGRNYIQHNVGQNTFADGAVAYYDVSAGNPSSVFNYGGISGINASAVPENGGFVKTTTEFMSSTATDMQPIIEISADGFSNSYLGDVTKGLNLYNVILRRVG